MCVFEDWMVRKGDPVLSRVKTPFLTFQDEVYYIILGEDAEMDTIKNAIKETPRIPFSIGIITSQPDELNILSSDENISKAELLMLAERTEKIVVSAYDGEGYLIWSKV